MTTVSCMSYLLQKASCLRLIQGSIVPAGRSPVRQQTLKALRQCIRMHHYAEKKSFFRGKTLPPASECFSPLDLPRQVD